MELKLQPKQWFKLLEKYKYLVLVVLIGVVLMLLPTQSGSKEETAQQRTEQRQESNISQQLADILGKINGVGKVEVMLTQASGEQTIYQTDDSAGDSGSGRQDTVIITDQNRGQSGLVLQVNAPKYRGAIVVCQGADSATVRLAVVDAVSKVTGLDSSRISVVKMK